MRRHVAAVVLCGLAASLALAGHPPGVVARNADKLSARIDAGDTDAYALDLAAGGSLGLTVKAKTPLRPAIRVFDPAGTEVDVAALIKGAGKATVSLKGMNPAPGTTGTWKVLVEGTGGTTGLYTAQFAVKHPATTKSAGLPVPANGTARVEFPAATGTLVKVTVTEKSGGPLAGAAVLGPGGALEAGGDVFTRKNTKLTLTPVTAGSGFGKYAVELRGGAADAVADVTVTVKFAKTTKRTATIAPEATVNFFLPQTAKQGDVAKPADIQGTGFLAGTVFEYDDAGMVVHTVTLDATHVHFSLDVGAAVPFGSHRVTAYPPPLEGEPVVVGSTTIRAPDPLLAGTSFASVKQSETGVVLDVTGTGFRDGGALAISGAGVAVGPTTIISPTLARTTLSTAADATLGLRDVTYTQPAAGGGAVATLSDAFSVFAPDPVLTSISVASVRQGDAAVNFTLTGAQFRDGGTVSASGGGVSVSNMLRVSNTTFTATFAVAANAAFGARDITYTQPAAGGGANIALTSAISVKAPLPGVTSVAPLVLRQGETNTTLTLTGSGLRDGGAITIAGPGLTLGATTVVNDTTATVAVSIASDATFGARDVTFTQPAAGGGDAATKIAAVTINAPVPAATNASPGTLRQGDADVVVTVTGTGFRTGGAITISGTGLTLGSTNVVGPTSATVSVTVASAATVGTRNVTFTQPAAGGADAGTLNAGLTINAPDPTIESVSPTSLRQGDSNVTVTLIGTGFRTGGTIALSGPGLTLGSVTVVSETTATVPVSVAASAAFGARDATFTQSAGGGAAAATKSNALTILAPVPTVTNVAAGIVKQNDTGVTLTLTGTGFRAGGVVTIAGAGLTLGSTTFVSDTSVTVTVSIASGAPVGARDVTYTQPAAAGSDSGTMVNGLTVDHPDPTYTALVEGVVTQGQSGVNLMLTGSSFRDGATVDLGSGVTVQSYVRNSDTQATVVADIGANASVGVRSTTYTQPAAGGGASATLVNSLQVRAPTPTVTSLSAPTAVKQGDASVTITVNGANFRSNCVVTFSGTGLTLGSTTFVSTSQVTVVITSVASNAALGTRDVVVTQSAAGGGASGTGTNLLTMNYPNPTITSVTPTQVARNGTGTFTVDGTNFRAGFSVTTTSTGVTLSNLQLVSAAQRPAAPTEANASRSSARVSPRATSSTSAASGPRRRRSSTSTRSSRTFPSRHRRRAPDPVPSTSR